MTISRDEETPLSKHLSLIHPRGPQSPHTTAGVSWVSRNEEYMSDWHVNEALIVLKKQLREVYPKLVFYTIGDKNHKPPSDHIPNQYGRVNAGDIMLGNGFDRDDAKALVACLQEDDRVKYMIFMRRIFYPGDGGGWIDYHGDNPHTDHIHLSVKDLAHLQRSKWKIRKDTRVVAFKNISGYLPTILFGDSDETVPGHYVFRAQQALNILVEPNIKTDGEYGPKTAEAVAKVFGGEGTSISDVQWKKLYNIHDHA